MKTQLKVNNAPLTDIRCTPPELRAAVELIAARITELMRLHGIKSLSAKPVQVGAIAVPEVTFEPLATTPPGAYAATQKMAVRKLAEYMAIFGITSIDILPDEKDMGVITETWNSLMARGAALQKEAPAKAPPTVDPTGKSVLPPEVPK